jgi:hypothetical protein
VIDNTATTELAAATDSHSTRPEGTAALLNRAASASAGEGTVDGNGSVRSEADHHGREPLFVGNELGGFRQRWQDVQGSFVDDPRAAVRNADELVANVMTRLAEIFADERGKLEHEWDKGENVSTEDLRVALRRYRSFFDRLLAV